MADVTTDRVRFAREVLGVDPFDHQVEALRSAAPNVVVAGGRRSGKTEASHVAALHVLHVHAGAQWLVTGPNEAKVRQYVGEAADLLRRSPLGSGSTLDELAGRLRLRNGSELLGLPPTPGQLRGFGRRVFGATIEEAGFAPSGVWSDLRYVLLDNRERGAQAWLIGSPWGGPGHFFHDSHRRGVEGDPDYAAFTWPTRLNPRIPAEWVDRERERVNGIEAAAELDGLWQSSDGEQMFPRGLLDECTAPVELPRLLALSGSARPAVGVDFGVNFDRSAAVAAFRLPGLAELNPDVEARPRLVVVPHLWPTGERLGAVVDDLVAAPLPGGGWMAPERNGVGAMPAQELRHRLRARRNVGFCSVHTNAAIKLTAYGLLRWALERHQLVLPREPDLLRQLAGLRLTTSATGSPRLEAEHADVHDDLCDAAAWSMLPVQGQGRVSCTVAGWLRPGPRFVPDALVPRLDVPIVETGAGLRLPLRPALQSVDGQAVSLPAGVRWEWPTEADDGPGERWRPDDWAGAREAAVAALAASAGLDSGGPRGGPTTPPAGGGSEQA